MRSLFSFRSILPRAALLALAFTSALALHLSAADTARRGQTETALDRYVAKPDPHYSWQKVGEARDDGATGYAIDLVSQHWLTSAEVNRPEWRHWLLVVKPDNVAHSTALLFISGGSNRPGPPPRPSRELVEIAKRTRSVVVDLRMVPNQTLVFHGDGQERKEDDLIGYGWDQFLRTGDERWPARLPMTKAAVRAMDTATAFLGSEAGGNTKVDTFVVAGASKRGWTAWATAAVDRRVIAVVPIVIDILNIEPSILHHWRAYGFYAPAVGDYVRHGIMPWHGTPEAKALYTIEDPFAYRDRLTMPKLLVNAAGDQFFLPDSSRHYFSELQGPKFIRYIPNTDHGLRDTDAFQTLRAWQHAILERRPLPQFTWRHDANGALVVTTTTKPTATLLWQAHNPAARDFRLESLGPVWKSSPLTSAGDTFTAMVAKPAQGWSAYFVELTFDLGLDVPLKLTTEVTVTPDTLPFPPPTDAKPRGHLQQKTTP